jgi:STE24 endopeptidase
MTRRTIALIAVLALAVFTTVANAEALSATAADSVPTAPTVTFSADAATAAYMATLSAQAVARSDAYFEGGYWLVLWDFVVAVLAAWVLLRTKLSARMRNLAERATRFKWLQTAIYSLQYVAFTFAITLPWAAYEGYVREHSYGMSNQSVAAWLGDEFKGVAIGLILGTLALVAIYAVIRKAPKRWWLWGSAVALAFVVFSATIGPSYLEPVFNKFYPLAESPLKGQILSLARANGIPATQVYEFDASKQTTKMSAHVSGLFGSVQISMNDNLMNRASPEEVRAVLGHEMGHYVLNHEDKGIVYIAWVIVVGFAFLSWAFERMASRYGPQWGLRGITDVAGLPLLAALFSAYVFVLTPVINTVGRTIEAEADAFGLAAARQPDGFAQAALHLSEYRKMHPGPVEEFVFFDHPSGWHRIHRAMVWKAENIATPDLAAYDAEHHPPGTHR